MAIVRKVLLLSHNTASVLLLHDEDVEKEKFKPSGIHHLNHKHLKQKNSHYTGQRVPEDPTYYEELARSVADADEILVVSHGKGKSSAGLAFLKYIGKHHHNLLDNIIGMESLDQMTDPQLAAHARSVFHDVEHRRHLGFEC
ncbi:MAG: hypothetical protein HRT77_12670 [Halioglobus sp.]|nr:hypothetical protein [Halioglobus sp.]